MMYVLGLIFMLYQESSPPPQAQPERQGESAQEILHKVAEAYRALDSYDSSTMIVVNAPEMEDMGTLALYGHNLRYRKSGDLLAVSQEGSFGFRWEQGQLTFWHDKLEQWVPTIKTETLSYAEVDKLSTRLQPRVWGEFPLYSMELPFLLGEDLEAIIPKARISYLEHDHPEMEGYKRIARFRGISAKPGDPVPIHVLRLETDRFDMHLVIRQTDYMIAGFEIKTTFKGIGGCSDEPIIIGGVIIIGDKGAKATQFDAPEEYVNEKLDGGVPELIDTLEDFWLKSMLERKDELREQIEFMREDLEAMEENHPNRESYACMLERMASFLKSLDEENGLPN